MLCQYPGVGAVARARSYFNLACCRRSKSYRVRDPRVHKLCRFAGQPQPTLPPASACLGCRPLGRSKCLLSRTLASPSGPQDPRTAGPDHRSRVYSGDPALAPPGIFDQDANHDRLENGARLLRRLPRRGPAPHSGLRSGCARSPPTFCWAMSTAGSPGLSAAFTRSAPRCIRTGALAPTHDACPASTPEPSR